jgi:ethanolamine ammonia-lyase small subunit
MSDHTPSLPDAIRALTEARLTAGPRGRALATRASLGFALDHARAREAVAAELDLDRARSALQAAGLGTRTVTSAAGNRDTYIRRPDQGRILPDAEAETLRGAGPCDMALVLGDGLSGIAANLSGPAFLVALAARLAEAGLIPGPVILARQARVALGDPIAAALGASTVVVALGERPGLSAADSLGVYITQGPRIGTPDSARNCLSNIREGGTGIDDAAERAVALIRAMRQLGQSGVVLSQKIASGALAGPEA